MLKMLKIHTYTVHRARKAGIDTLEELVTTTTALRRVVPFGRPNRKVVCIFEKRS